MAGPGRSVGDVTAAGEPGGGRAGESGESAGQSQPTGDGAGDVSSNVATGGSANEEEAVVTSDRAGVVNTDSVVVQLG